MKAQEAVRLMQDEKAASGKARAEAMSWHNNQVHHISEMQGQVHELQNHLSATIRDNQGLNDNMQFQEMNSRTVLEQEADAMIAAGHHDIHRMRCEMQEAVRALLDKD